nr:putative receptor like protein 25 [Malus domestica]
MASSSSSSAEGPFLNITSNLSAFDLHSNQLKGPIPMFPRLATYLDYSRNNFSSSIPADIGDFLMYTVFFSLESNHFHGIIPASVCRATYLQVLDLSNNLLSGMIPQCFTTRNSCYLDISCNKFSGSIPEELVVLKSLFSLNFSNNAFTGAIPSCVGNLRHLESLDLSNNRLSGTIPSELSKLNFLSFLNLSNNRLVGKIPTGTQIQSFSADSFAGNEGLYGPPLSLGNIDDGSARLSPTLEGKHSNSAHGIDWDLISAEVGFVGFGTATGSLVLCKRWSKWYYKTM